jgi:ABC-type uncharacterized transport system permease subunit
VKSTRVALAIARGTIVSGTILRHKRASVNDFIEGAVFEMASQIILVVNDLTTDDQSYIAALTNMMRKCVCMSSLSSSLSSLSSLSLIFCALFHSAAVLCLQKKHKRKPMAFF